METSREYSERVVVKENTPLYLSIVNRCHGEIKDSSGTRRHWPAKIPKNEVKPATEFKTSSESKAVLLVREIFQRLNEEFG